MGIRDWTFGKGMGRKTKPQRPTKLPPPPPLTNRQYVLGDIVIRVCVNGWIVYVSSSEQDEYPVEFIAATNDALYQLIQDLTRGIETP